MDDENNNYDSSDSDILLKKDRVVHIADSDTNDEHGQSENINGDRNDLSEWENDDDERDDIFQQIKFWAFFLQLLIWTQCR